MAKVLLKISDPNKSTDNESVLSADDPMRASFDLRDRVADLIEKGNTLNPHDKAGIYENLTSILGRDKAQKIMTHAYIFNTRPEIQKLPMADKIRAFYSIGSSDPEVTNILSRTRNLGYGVVAGARDRISDLNPILSSKQAATTQVIPAEVKKKIMLKTTR